jgi:hypothetical protein
MMQTSFRCPGPAGYGVFRMIASPGSRLAGGNASNAVRTHECMVPRWSGVPPNSLIATTSPSRV